MPVGAGAVGGGYGFQSVCWYTNDEPSAFSVQEESSIAQNSGCKLHPLCLLTSIIDLSGS